MKRSMKSLRRLIPVILFAIWSSIFPTVQASAQPLSLHSSSVTVSTSTLPSPEIVSVIEKDGEVDLVWNQVAGASFYNVYRSLKESQNYTLIKQISASTYVPTAHIYDTGLTNLTNYYYVITSVDPAGNESWYSNEITAMPHLIIEWAGSMYPAGGNLKHGSFIPDITFTLGQAIETDPVFGEVFIGSATGSFGPATKYGMRVQLGYGLPNTAPAAWTHWVDAVYVSPSFINPANDLYRATLMPDTLGDYLYYYRFSTTGGRDWIYAGETIWVTDPTQPVAAGNDEVGYMKVVPAETPDVIPPANPAQPQVQSTDYRSVTLDWSPNSEPDLLGYEIFRSTSSSGPFTLVDKVQSSAMGVPPAHGYTDVNLVAGNTYFYRLKAYDLSYNRSGFSTSRSASTVSHLLTLTVNATVPSYTPSQVFFSNCIDYSDAYTCNTWNPTPYPMTLVGAEWTAQIQIEDGTPLSLFLTAAIPSLVARRSEMELRSRQWFNSQPTTAQPENRSSTTW